ncbi:Regulatory protein [Trichinella spiralis]|uniref:Regulatory protein n=2 Tax=Trichinella spiralis TaxID=6334 RepID=A0ABR3K1T3_TRISP
MESTALLPPFFSTKINFQVSNCTRKQFPIDMVRKKNGCSSTGSTNDAIICTALHRGLYVPFQKYMEPLLHCYKANSSETFEAEKKIFLHWKLAYANLVSGLE